MAFTFSKKHIQLRVWIGTVNVTRTILYFLHKSLSWRKQQLHLLHVSILCRNSEMDNFNVLLKEKQTKILPWKLCGC